MIPLLTARTRHARNLNQFDAHHEHLVEPKHKTLPIALALAMALSPIAMFALPTSAYADTQTDLDEKLAEVETLSSEIEELSTSIEQNQADIDALLSEIDEKQSERIEAQDSLSLMLRNIYKSGEPSILDIIVSSSSIDELTSMIQYRESYMNKFGDKIDTANDTLAELQKSYDDVSAKKTQQEDDLKNLKSKKESLDEQVDELRSKLQEEQQQARLEASASSASASAAQVEQTFATGDTTGWQTGVASAYGGSSDSSTGAVATTATGARCDDYSMGVAVPMAWPNYSSYFGRKVEISYGGKSVIAAVNDCGGMGGGSRSLDLQPGVFKAFGFSTCQAWGLRTVSFRFL